MSAIKKVIKDGDELYINASYEELSKELSEISEEISLYYYDPVTIQRCVERLGLLRASLAAYTEKRKKKQVEDGSDNG